MNRLLFAFSILFFVSQVIVAQSPRVSLYEEFTGETCPPCASTNPKLNDTLALPANAAKMVAIKWQVPIPSAPTKTWSLYQTNKTEINWRYSAYGYGVNSAPQGRIDGQSQTVYGAPSDHPVYLSSSIISTAASYTSPFSITMNREWNMSCTAVNLTITVQATANFSAVGNLVFRTVMVERLIQFSVQPGTNGEKDFEDVAIKSFPSIQSGVALQKNWTSGQSHTFTLSCAIPSYTRKKAQIAMVGFIQDDGNRKVMQAARTSTDIVPAEALAQLRAKADLTCNGSITPEVMVRNDGPAAISNLTIVPYNDNVASTPTTWNGNLAPNDSVAIVLNTISTPTASGGHTFSYDVVLSVPYYNLNGNKKTAPYMVATTVKGSDVTEDFAGNTFPPVSWAVINSNGTPGWSKTFSTGGYNKSSNAAKYDFYNNTAIGDVDELYLPPMDLAAAGDPVLSFDMAYASRNSRLDKLEILVSDNCGQNWSSIFSADGFNLSTIPSEVNSGAYSPDPFDSTHWTTKTFTLAGFNKPAVLVKFVTTSDNGNNLYLDNINLSKYIDVGLSEGKIRMSASVFPNPAQGESTLRIESAGNTRAKISVTNIMGQEVYSRDSHLNAGTNEIKINLGGLSAGVYNLQIETGTSLATKKINIIK